MTPPSVQATWQTVAQALALLQYVFAVAIGTVWAEAPVAVHHAVTPLHVAPTVVGSWGRRSAPCKPSTSSLHCEHSVAKTVSNSCELSTLARWVHVLSDTVPVANSLAYFANGPR